MACFVILYHKIFSFYLKSSRIYLPLGRVLANPRCFGGARKQATQTLLQFLARHQAGDWGGVCPEDAREGGGHLRRMPPGTDDAGRRAGHRLPDADRAFHDFFYRCSRCQARTTVLSQNSLNLAPFTRVTTRVGFPLSSTL
jgi:hypothetical protein